MRSLRKCSLQDACPFGTACGLHKDTEAQGLMGEAMQALRAALPYLRATAKRASSPRYPPAKTTTATSPTSNAPACAA
ncbi:hypothetical protein SAMN05216227_104130 [Pseudorhodobacter antarcticus]|uniref:Uncharacterized protein n=1 Tax=Pseudorhodobacter antarcticus TaxID=1077947 RepID=A0A1H8LFM5_9RHOB|nr:hypothetical protein SAMN05216227_104130 [Pseudorhodobacter antarcticus]